MAPAVGWYTGMSEALQLERNRAYGLLLDAILTGRLGAGEPLSERKLAENFGMGRTPIREALRDLARDGVLEVQPARGTLVRRPTMEDLRQIYEVRYGLEGMAAALAAERGATAELKACGEVFRDMLHAPDAYSPSQVYEFGAEFHLKIFRAARNRHLIEIYQPLRLRARVALALPRHYDHDRVRASVDEHIAILDAIEAGRAETARELICAHLERGLEARLRIFRQLGGVPDMAGNGSRARP